MYIAFFYATQTMATYFVRKVHDSMMYMHVYFPNIIFGPILTLNTGIHNKMKAN